MAKTVGEPTAAQQLEPPTPGVMTSSEMNRKAQMICVWLGPAMFILYGIGGIWLARYLPPDIHPNDSAQTVANWYVENQDRIRIGLVFIILAFGCIGFWGICMCVQTRRKEGLFPALTYAQLVGMAGGTGLLMVQVGMWAAAAWRPGEIPATTTQTLNDIGWMLLLGTWFPFTIWCIALGLSILLDPSDNPTFPRWSGYLSVWMGLGFVPGSCTWFFKDGAFSWVGAAALYVPFITFAIWVIAFTWLSYGNIKRGYVHEQPM